MAGPKDARSSNLQQDTDDVLFSRPDTATYIPICLGVQP